MQPYGMRIQSLFAVITDSPEGEKVVAVEKTPMIHVNREELVEIVERFKVCDEIEYKVVEFIRKPIIWD